MEVELERDITPKLVGETYMKYATKNSRQRNRFGIYECPYCGKEWEVETIRVTGGYTKSCGCQRGKSNKKHGLSLSRFYSIWHNMLDRCYNKNSKRFNDYGGRGIKVCGEWLDIKNFVDWVDNKSNWEEGLTLDRIDNDKGYSPENCRWVDRATQGLNQRMKKNNTSGFVGVNWKKDKNKWVVNIKHHKVLKYVGGFKTKEEAVLARDQYIIKNKLPHKLSTQY